MNEEFVDVAAIEKELQKLWADMGAGKSGEREAVTRACVHNLIVYAPGENSDAEVNAIIGEVTVQNPGRVVILLPDPSKKEKKANAFVSAQCYRTAGTRQQVCCEQIIVRADGEAVLELPSLLAPLVIPDLPVFVWWRTPVGKGIVFDELLEFADRAIIDTAIDDQSQNIQDVTQMLLQNKHLCAFSDLNWARLTIWRELIAKLFDAPDARHQLNEIIRLEVFSGRPFSLQPLFLVSWLGSRLNWKIDSTIKTENETIRLKGTNGSKKNVEIVISKSDSATEDKNLESVRLHSENNSFSVSSKKELFHLEVSSLAARKVTFSQDQKFTSLDEADLLRKELQILGHDYAYEQALQFLNNLL
jgi:glucose-6-phosphate dehydrogenase assembly protein OpcA